MSNPPPPAPPGYKPPQNIFTNIDDSSLIRLIIRLNFLALIPLTIGILILWLPYQIYLIRGLPWQLFSEPAWPPAIDVSLYALIIFASIIIHELIHALFMKWLGHKSIITIHWGFLTAGIPYGDFLPRNHYTIIALAPLLIMTLCGGIFLLLLPPTFGQPLLIALLINFPASIGDLLVAQRVSRYTKQTLFASNYAEIFAYRLITS